MPIDLLANDMQSQPIDLLAGTEEAKTPLQSYKEKLTQAGVLGTGGALGYGVYRGGAYKPIAKGAVAIGQALKQTLTGKLSTEGSANFADKIQKEFVKTHTDKVNQFGSDIDTLSAKNPDRNISLQNVVDDIKTNWDTLPNEAKNVFNKTPHLRDMLKAENPISPEINLSKSQEIINYMNTKVPKNIRYNNLDVLDTVNNVRGSQLEAFPEMEGVRTNYRNFIEPYNNVKGYFRFNKLISAIENRFGGAQGQMAVKKILPPEVYEEMLAFRRSPSISKLSGKTTKFLTGKGFLGVLPTVTSILPALEIAADPRTKDLSETQKLMLMLNQAAGGNTESILKGKSALESYQKKKDLTSEEIANLYNVGGII
jgi:hypothetical protein